MNVAVPLSHATTTVSPTTVNTASALPTNTPVVPVTSLSKHLPLHDGITTYILAPTILVGIPLLVMVICVVRKCVVHRREKIIIDAEYKSAPIQKLSGLPQLPPTPGSRADSFVHPEPRPALRREGTIAGPFNNTAFDEADVDGRRCAIVTPSFVSTRVVDEPGFGMGRARYQYIP
ncbi:hypothetical protein DPMN_174216 [Dreissena polymorpha]|uniref:Uncharacterized protein n=1 Tax=Dreissena polymorpha TaxID=45954 RepID=A0A9D4E311_DREPO|nr:hypothetical protein DPMN_174216 [Dreissena polymorpha]